MSQQKSMNLEEFKQALSSDATKQNDQLRRIISSQKQEIKKKTEEIDNRKLICKVMFNRCLALTMGTTCSMCGHRDLCERERTVGRA